MLSDTTVDASQNTVHVEKRYPYWISSTHANKRIPRSKKDVIGSILCGHIPAIWPDEKAALAEHRKYVAAQEKTKKSVLSRIRKLQVKLVDIENRFNNPGIIDYSCRLTRLKQLQPDIGELKEEKEHELALLRLEDNGALLVSESEYNRVSTLFKKNRVILNRIIHSELPYASDIEKIASIVSGESWLTADCIQELGDKIQGPIRDVTSELNYRISAYDTVKPVLLSRIKKIKVRIAELEQYLWEKMRLD